MMWAPHLIILWFTRFLLTYRDKLEEMLLIKMTMRHFFEILTILISNLQCTEWHKRFKKGWLKDQLLSLLNRWESQLKVNEITMHPASLKYHTHYASAYRLRFPEKKINSKTCAIHFNLKYLEYFRSVPEAASYSVIFDIFISLLDSQNHKVRTWYHNRAPIQLT